MIAQEAEDFIVEPTMDDGTQTPARHPRRQQGEKTRAAEACPSSEWAATERAAGPDAAATFPATWSNFDSNSSLSLSPCTWVICRGAFEGKSEVGVNLAEPLLQDRGFGQAKRNVLLISTGVENARP